jgi:hypothetical protein
MYLFSSDPYPDWVKMLDPDSSQSRSTTLVRGIQDVIQLGERLKIVTGVCFLKAEKKISLIKKYV